MTCLQGRDLRFAVALFVALVAAAMISAPAALASPDARFEQRPLEVPEEKYFDLGVADVDGDSDYDLYSSNHNYPSVLQLSDGAGALDPVPAGAGFAPMPEFPGIEDLFHPPEPTEPGLYLYTARGEDPTDARGHIVIRTIGIPGGAQIELGFTERQVVAGSTENAEVEIGRRDAGFGAKVLVEAGPTATAVLIPRHLDLPIRVRVTDAVPLEQVGVGAELVRPSAHGFDLRFRDRHGIAWGDYDGDGSSDSFIAGGGLSSEIDAYEAIVADELLLGDGGGARGAPSFTDAYDDSRLRKGACRTREAAALDYDLDGTADLFLSCEGELPRLALGRNNGKFRDRSGLIRIVGDTGRGPAYRWVELNGDPGLELAVATEQGLRLYERKVKALELVAELGGRHSRGIGNIAVGDFDSDSDADLLVPSPGGTTLYTNRRGVLTPRDPRKFGLPGARVRAASWIDFNNDGRLDLHAHPRGLYKGSTSGEFGRTPFLRLPEPDGEARVSWFDGDGDGDLEPVSTTRVRDSSRWVPLRYENTGRTRHWLAVDLGRPGGGPTALGARVRIRTADGVSTSWAGAREGARYSSGNYRVHFGLANRKSARWLKIDWPDGTRQRIKDPEIDRVQLVEPPRRKG